MGGIVSCCADDRHADTPNHTESTLDQMGALRVDVPEPTFKDGEPVVMFPDPPRRSAKVHTIAVIL